MATISGTGLAQGDARIYRMNKSTYGQLMKLMCDEAMSYKYTRTGERISIDGDQATITSDVAESFVSNGRNIVTKVRNKAVIELIDGKLMLVQLVSNHTVIHARTAYEDAPDTGSRRHLLRLWLSL